MSRAPRQMTVRRLISRLQELPLDALVTVVGHGAADDGFLINVTEVGLVDPDEAADDYNMQFVASRRPGRAVVEIR